MQIHDLSMPTSEIDEIKGKNYLKVECSTVLHRRVYRQSGNTMNTRKKKSVVFVLHDLFKISRTSMLKSYFATLM